MRRLLPRSRGRAAALLLVTGALLWAPTPGGADPTASPSQLRRQNGAFEARTQRAVLDLYAAATQLAAARSRFAALQDQAARVRAKQLLVRRQVAIAQQALRVSQRQLAARLRLLYEQGSEPDALAILLGSSSLDEAISTLDALNRAARQNQRVIQQTTRTRRSLNRLAATLAARSSTLHALELSAMASATALETVQAERSSLVASLRTKERLNRRTIASLEAVAQAAQAKSATLTPATATTTTLPSDPAQAVPDTAPSAGADPALAVVPLPVDGSTITVSATGYSLAGHTATGLPVGIGVVAVDPSVIPLGTHLSIPGYGEGVAADTGSGVRGATIDLWFPTLTQARAWGRRTITITLH